MYDIDCLDMLVEIDTVPKQDVGAPLPLVFAHDNALVLSYWVLDPAPNYLSPGLPRAIFRFHRVRFHSFGSPNDEALHGHPLATRGLRSYSVFEVKRSSLLRGLERMNRVHPRHNPKRFDEATHYIFTFHDTTFEVVADSFTTSILQIDEGEAFAATLKALIGELYEDRQ